MKKMIALCTVLTLALAGTALAKPMPTTGGFTGAQPNSASCSIDSETCQVSTIGGFKGPSMSVSTVEQAKKMSDDQKVALRGYIIQSLGDKDYLFKDDTGTIQVEINHRRWQGQEITPNDLVEIQGEVDKDWRSIEIDVKRIIKVNTDK